MKIVLLLLACSVFLCRGPGISVPDRLLGRLLTNPAAFAPRYRDSLDLAARAVTAPGEFYVEIEEEENGRVYVLHLWHTSAFLPENREMSGNPGGQCRDVRYDAVRNRIIRIEFWQ